MARKLFRKCFKKIPPPPQTRAQTHFCSFRWVPSEGSSTRRPGREDPHRRERTFILIQSKFLLFVLSIPWPVLISIARSNLSPSWLPLTCLQMARVLLLDFCYSECGFCCNRGFRLGLYFSVWNWQQLVWHWALFLAETVWLSIIVSVIENSKPLVVEVEYSSAQNCSASSDPCTVCLLCKVAIFHSLAICMNIHQHIVGPPTRYNLEWELSLIYLLIRGNSDFSYGMHGIHERKDNRKYSETQKPLKIIFSTERMHYNKVSSANASYSKYSKKFAVN
jgi:hypothetical protein